MRIRNRPTSFPSSFPPSTNLPTTPCTNLPKLASLQPVAAAPAPRRATSGKSEVKGVVEGRGEARESAKEGHFLQIECCFARGPSALVSGDGDKMTALGHVGMEAWKSSRGKKLSTAPGGSGKRLVEEVDGSNGTLKKLVAEASTYETVSKGSSKRRDQEAYKKRSRDNGTQEWSDVDELILPTKKMSKIKLQKQANNVASGRKELMQELDYEEKKEEDAYGADVLGKNKSMNGKISGSKKTKAGADVGGSLMEGSRCSRINGRGWRCSQLTLVGYSLCEHHLGKARLKSMSSIRGRQSAASRLPQTGTNPNHHALTSNIPSLDHDNATDDQMPLIEAMKGHAKKINVGSVKARSMSSLLGVNTNAHLAS